MAAAVDVAALRPVVSDTSERLLDEVVRLRALSGLFQASYHGEGAKAFELHELCFLIDPIIERQKALIDGLLEAVGVSV